MYIHDSGHALMTKFLDDQFLAILFENSWWDMVTKALIILFLSHPLWVFARKYCD